MSALGLALLMAAQLAAATSQAPPRARHAGRTPAVQVKPAPPVTRFRADASEYLYRQRKFTLTGNVVFTRADATLSCDRASGENDEAGDIRRAVCDGHVELRSPDIQVSCPKRAIYDGEAVTVSCPGSAVLRKAESISEVQDLVYDLGADKVTVKNQRGTLVQRPGENLPLGAKRKAPR